MNARSALRAFAVALAFASSALASSAFADDAGVYAVAGANSAADPYSFITVSLLPRIAPGNGGPDVDTSLSINVLAGERANMRGLELSYGVNVETGNVAGVQIAGLVNAVAGDVSGFQASPGVNVAGKRVTGMQLGLVNVAGETAGFQLGIVNVSREVSGVSLGLVSIEDGGILEGMTRCEAERGMPLRIGIGLKVGTKKAYSAFYASLPPFDGGTLTIDAGWGIRSNLGSVLLDCDASWRAVQGMGFRRDGERPAAGSFVLRACARKRGFPLIVGAQAELLIAGVSPLGDGTLSPSTRSLPGFFVGSAILGKDAE